MSKTVHRVKAWLVIPMLCFFIATPYMLYKIEKKMHTPITITLKAKRCAQPITKRHITPAGELRGITAIGSLEGFPGQTEDGPGSDNRVLQF